MFKKLFHRKSIVRIIYKSGVVQDIKCTKFTIKKDFEGALTFVEWTNDAYPNPMAIGISNIEAIYQLR